MFGKRVDLDYYIMVAWVTSWWWNTEHMEFHFFFISSIVELLLHSPVQEYRMLQRISVVKIISDVFDTTLLVQRQFNLSISIRS